MANWNDPQPTRQGGFGASPSLNGEVIGKAGTYDQGLRRHMLSIYNYMASGVLLSGIIALLVGTSEVGVQMMRSPLWLIVALAPLAFIFVFPRMPQMKTSTLQAMFWAFCVIMGLSMATIFVRFTGTSIATTFFATAGAFAGLSLVGYTTKRDLTPMRAFLTMGVVGIVIALLINLVLSLFGIVVPGLMTAISIIGVLVFAGLTAYDTQRLKDQYAYVAGSDMAGKVVIMGALTLYLDFVNMFTFLLQLLGDRR